MQQIFGLYFFKINSISFQISKSFKSKLSFAFVSIIQQLKISTFFPCLSSIANQVVVVQGSIHKIIDIFLILWLNVLDLKIKIYKNKYG